MVAGSSARARHGAASPRREGNASLGRETREGAVTRLHTRRCPQPACRCLAPQCSRFPAAGRRPSAITPRNQLRVHARSAARSSTCHPCRLFVDSCVADRPRRLRRRPRSARDHGFKTTAPKRPSARNDPCAPRPNDRTVSSGLELPSARKLNQRSGRRIRFTAPTIAWSGTAPRAQRLHRAIQRDRLRPSTSCPPFPTAAQIENKMAEHARRMAITRIILAPIKALRSVRRGRQHTRVAALQPKLVRVPHPRSRGKPPSAAGAAAGPSASHPEIKQWIKAGDVADVVLRRTMRIFTGGIERAAASKRSAGIS